VYYTGTIGAVVTCLLPGRRCSVVATLYSHSPVEYHFGVHHSTLVSFSHTPTMVHQPCKSIHKCWRCLWVA